MSGLRVQKGMALFVSLIFLLLLTIIGVASMQNAGVQEKMAGNVKLKNETFQLAERALRQGENYIANVANAGAIAGCSQCSGNECRPPPISGPVSTGGGVCGAWKSAAGGAAFYQIQKLGPTSAAVNLQNGSTVTLYRVTAVASKGNARSALESIYAKSN